MRFFYYTMCINMLNNIYMKTREKITHSYRVECVGSVLYNVSGSYTAVFFRQFFLCWTNIHVIIVMYVVHIFI